MTQNEEACPHMGGAVIHKTHYFSNTSKQIRKSPDLKVRAINMNLAMTYSRMGKPHTTIGATAFHF